MRAVLRGGPVSEQSRANPGDPSPMVHRALHDAQATAPEPGGLPAPRGVEDAERRRILAELERSEGRYRLIADNVSDSITIIDLETLRYRYANPAAERTSGRRPEELVGTSLAEVLTPESYATAVAQIRQGIAEGEAGAEVTRNLELELQRPDGTRLWVEVAARLVRDTAGHPLEIVAVTRDISARRQAEARLRYTMHLERVIAEASSQLVAVEVEDFDAALQHALAAIGRFAGASRCFFVAIDAERGEMTDAHEWCIEGVAAAVEQARGQLIGALPWLEAELSAGRRLQISRLSELPREARVERAIWEASGVRALLISPMLQGARLLGFVGFDCVREERAWPPELGDLLDVMGRTFANAVIRKRAEEALRQAKAQAEEASRMKSRFLSNVSHEIRTPLSAIIGLAELILRGEHLEDARERASIVLREAEVLLALVNDLLDHQKIVEGKLTIVDDPLDLEGLLSDVASLGRLHCGQKGLAFRLDVSNDVPRFVRGDALRLRQVLVNLLANAVKFTHEGSVGVVVEHVAAEPGRDWIEFAVLDTGIGIAPERQAAIFESFVQADSRTTRQYGGSGLGTTIARELVELMGGRIELKSMPGGGSTFWFSVPLNHCDEQSRVDSEPPSVRWSPRPTRILVAEDYLVNQQIVLEHLESAGYQVTLVDNGEDAISACALRPFDLVLLDYQMPGLDGCEAARRIRARGLVGPHVPIIALTASGEATVRRQCLANGMTMVITKPIRRAALLDAVQSCLARAAAGDGTLEATPTAPPPDDLDVTELIQQFGGNRALASSILESFKAGLPRDIASIQRALEANDLGSVRRIAHALRGGAASVCAPALAERARQLEEHASAGQSSEAADCAQLLSEACSRFALTRSVL